MVSSAWSVAYATMQQVQPYPLSRVGSPLFAVAPLPRMYAPIDFLTRHRADHRVLRTLDAHPSALRIEPRQFDIRRGERLIVATRPSCRAVAHFIERDGKFVTSAKPNRKVASTVITNIEAFGLQFFVKLDDGHSALH